MPSRQDTGSIISADNLNLITGIGYNYFNLNLDEMVVTDENGNIINQYIPQTGYHNFSLGVGIEYFARFSAGYTYKHIYFDNGNDIRVGSILYEGYKTSSAYDLGCILTIPITDVYNKISGQQLKLFGEYYPSFVLSFGTSMSNIGEDMAFWGVSSALPRQAKIGYGLSLQFDGILHAQNIRFFKFDWSSEAEDILVDLYTANTQYRSYPGSIKLWDNVILGKTDGEVIINSGLNINFFQFIGFRWGKRKQSGESQFYNYTSTGLTISTRGPLLLLSEYIQDDILNFIAQHMEFRYLSAKYESERRYEIDGFSGLFISLNIFK